MPDSCSCNNITSDKCEYQEKSDDTSTSGRPAPKGLPLLIAPRPPAAPLNGEGSGRICARGRICACASMRGGGSRLRGRGYLKCLAHSLLPRLPQPRRFLFSASFLCALFRRGFPQHARTQGPRRPEASRPGAGPERPRYRIPRGFRQSARFRPGGPPPRPAAIR